MLTVILYKLYMALVLDYQSPKYKRKWKKHMKPYTEPS